MKHKIDMRNSPRRAHFEYFLRMANPFVGVTVNVDATELVAACRREGRSFYAAMIHAAARAANRVPELRRRKLSYTVFIAPGLLGRKNYITEDELRTLAADPLCTVGAHTMRHEMLRFQKASAVRGELSGSKAYLEAALSREILNFAYPYGSVYACSRANIEQVQACGFRRGFSTLSRSVTASDLREPWFLPRRNINDTNLQRKGF